MRYNSWPASCVHGHSLVKKIIRKDSVTKAAKPVAGVQLGAGGPSTVQRGGVHAQVHARASASNGHAEAGNRQPRVGHIQGRAPRTAPWRAAWLHHVDLPAGHSASDQGGLPAQQRRSRAGLDTNGATSFSVGTA